MSLKERISTELEQFSDAELQRIGEYMAFLRFQSRIPTLPLLPQDDARLASLYAEFADEDHALAEVGMADYAQGLAREDAA